jgi:allophanate hydrolase subunit 2
MAIKVNAPGLATSVQDLGRPGYYHLGIPISGGMDRFSLRAANMLVGNDEGAAVLEAVFMGPELAFTSNALVAVTGADLPPLVDGEPRETWTSFTVKAGQVLSFDFLKGGARAYIAISGGIDTPVALGSRSTYALGALGGHHGRNLQAGDELPLGEANGGAGEGRGVPENLRRMPGATEADRIGYRFKGGSPLEFVEREQPFGAGSDPSNIVDACYPYGSIQVPGGTEPIVLHRDAVSGGGYFMLGTVISADMDTIGQLQPHTKTRFVPVDMEGALAARRDRHALLDKIRQTLA